MECSIRTADRCVVQHGASLGALDGCTTEEVDEATAQAIMAALAQPNGGVTLSADHATVTALPYVDPPPPPPPQPNETELALLAQVEGAQTIDDMKLALKAVMAAYVSAGSPTPPL